MSDAHIAAVIGGSKTQDLLDGDGCRPGDLSDRERARV
jgi:hypothetical protein